MDIRYIQNSILQIAMARKKFLLADTIEAVQATSMWFGLIVSARNNRLDAKKHLIYVLYQLSVAETVTDELVKDVCHIQTNYQHLLECKRTGYILFAH